MNASGVIIKKNIFLEKHEGSLLQRMNKLRQENPNSFCDVSFNINGKKFHGHKFVLVSASEYFARMLEGHFCESKSYENITVKDVDAEAFDEILTAIYTSEFHLSRHNAYFILRASHMLLLTDIFEATASYILQDTGIDYLIETCLFATRISKDDLYRKCITAIASDLNNLSRTKVFVREITFDIFEGILATAKKNNLFEDDKALFRIIKKWCCYNKSKENAVHYLLNAADMKSGCLDKPSMVEYIIDCYPRFDRETVHITESSLLKQNSASNAGYNIYLNTINIEMGAPGWGIWQSKNGFQFGDDFKVIYYTDSNKGYRKVKQIGDMFYCFEYDVTLNCNLFYYIENYKKTFLKIPCPTTKSKYFDIEVLGNFVYLITDYEVLWKYNCEKSEWTKVPIRPNSYDESWSSSSFSQTGSYSNKRPFEDIINNFTPKLACNMNSLYVVGLKQWDAVRVIPNQPVGFWTNNRIGHLYKTANPAVCCWQNKLVVSGSNHDGKLHNEVSAYDIVAGKWKEMSNMICGRVNHLLTYDNQYLYAIENNPGVINEMYDTDIREWTDIPSLPERFDIIQNGKRIKLATGDLFNCSIKLTP